MQLTPFRWVKSLVFLLDNPMTVDGPVDVHCFSLRLYTHSLFRSYLPPSNRLLILCSKVSRFILSICSVTCLLILSSKFCRSILSICSVTSRSTSAILCTPFSTCFRRDGMKKVLCYFATSSFLSPSRRPPQSSPSWNDMAE